MILDDFYTKNEALNWEYYKEGEIFEEKIGRFLFFWRKGHCTSYEFIAIEWCANDGQDYFQRIAQGWVCFDGCRHIWFGFNKDEEMNGYDNYPHLKSYELLFKKLREINTELQIENN